jgi:hypothetical protein
MEAIEAASIVNGGVVLDNLILTKKDGTTVDAGNVRGAPGPVGPPGDVSDVSLRRGLFSAWRSAAFNVSPIAFTPVPMDAEEFDFSGWHDVSTGRFQPLLAGYYRLNVNIGLDTTVSSGTLLLIALFKNGVAWKYIQAVYTGGGQTAILSGTIIVYANGTTDYFQPGFYHNHSVAVNIKQGSGNGTRFQGELIAPAA